MVGYFSSYELDELRALSESGMGAYCTIKRNNTLLSPQPTMPNGSPLRCQISDGKADQQIEGADPTQKMRKIKISLPWNCPVQALDQVTAESMVYGVIEAPVQNSPNFNAKTVCYAYALYPLDANGNPGAPLYLRPNCVASVVHLDGTNGPQDVDAQLKTPDQRFTAQGGEQETYLLFAPTLIGQIRSSDKITISEYGGYTVSLGPYEVNNPRPTGDGGMVSLKVGLTGFAL